MKTKFQCAIASFGFFIMTICGACPAFGQVDLSGYWGNRPHEDNMARGPGLEVGEYEGYPINAAGRMKGYSWDGTIIANPERQCAALNIMTSNSSFRFWKEVDPVSQREIAWKLRIDYHAQERTIWMDGRPHPPESAAHTWQGFSTGKWVNNQLVVTTTHLKANNIERNGIPRSDAVTTVEHFIRRGDILTVVHIVYDPIWLEEPFIQTRDYTLELYQRPNATFCVPVNELANRPKGTVPHYLPGKNPLIMEASKKYGVPEVAARGGAETMYPDFMTKMKDAAARPQERRQMAMDVPVTRTKTDPDEILVMPVQGDVYMMAGRGVNTVVHVGKNFVFVIDTGAGPQTDKIIAAIRRLSDKPIRYVINTHLHSDHIGGNEAIAKAGTAIGAGGGGGGPQLGAGGTTPAPILAHENVLRRVSAPFGSVSTVPDDAWPDETYIGQDFRLFDGEAVKVIHVPAAHTDGDSIVYFPRSDVIAAGDVYSTITYPIIDRKNGGSINGMIAALNHIVDLTTPERYQEGGTYVIPGHGRISDQADVVEYRDMVTIIRDRIADMVKRGLTIEQVKAEQPTLDYDARYGTSTEWPKDMFIEAIYEDLRQGRSN